MVILTKLDNSKILLNLETIKYMESVPDTIVWFLNGESIIVKEPIQEINKLVIEYRAMILRLASNPENTSSAAVE